MSNNTIDYINIKDINKNYYILFNDLVIINKNDEHIIFDKYMNDNYNNLILYNLYNSKLNLNLESYLNRININCKENDYIYYNYLKNFEKNTTICNMSNLTNLIFNCIIYYILNYDIQKINEFKKIIEECIITYEKEKVLNDYFNIKIYFNKNIFKQINNLNLNINIILKNKYYNDINSISNINYDDKNNIIFNLNNDKNYSKIIYYNNDNINKYVFFENNNTINSVNTVNSVLISDLKIHYFKIIFNNQKDNENNICNKNEQIKDVNKDKHTNFFDKYINDDYIDDDNYIDDDDYDDYDDYDNYKDDDYEEDEENNEEEDTEEEDNEEEDNEEEDTEEEDNEEENIEEEDIEEEDNEEENIEEEDIEEEDNEEEDTEEDIEEEENDEEDEDNIKEPQLKKKKLEINNKYNISMEYTRKNKLFIKYICKLCNIDKDNINIDNIPKKENFSCKILLKDDNGNVISFDSDKRGRKPGKRKIYKFKLIKDIEQLGYKKDDTIGFGLLYPRCATTVKMKKARYFVILKKSNFSEKQYFITHMFYYKNHRTKEKNYYEFKELSKEKIYNIYIKLKNIYQTIQNVKKRT